MLRTSDFDYELPPSLIAQSPLPTRDQSRLLVLHRRSGQHADHIFADLPRLLPPGALLVLNDSRVFPARLRGHKETGGAVEVLLLKALPTKDPSIARWCCLCKSAKRLRPGQSIQFANGGERVTGHVEEVLAQGEAILDFVPAEDLATDTEWFPAWVERRGETPLPPYIFRPEGEQPYDRERYQTVYAREPGSVAAPTAGLHFTPTLLDALEEAGVERCAVTLHVGPGTFRPVRADRVDDHQMDAERVTVPPETVQAVSRARAEGRVVVAVGTTTVRALEGATGPAGALQAGTFDTDLFIRPGFRFQVVDWLVTNFHLPRSTLLMLVSALADRETILAAYGHAVRAGYRFYSYGDAMLIR